MLLHALVNFDYLGRMNAYAQYQQLIEDAIKRQPFTGKPAELYDPANYMLSLGGKRLRPVLVLMGCSLFNGRIEDALPAALAVEVFHNFTLIHDDIMDKAPLRRGKPTVHHKWNETVGILSGDLMMIRATQLICEVPVDDIRPLLNLFNQTAVEVCEGQQLDMNFETTENVSAEEYIQMIALKTAVLLGCSLKLGSLIAGASENDANALYAFGKNMGIAFQIQDDLLDSFGNAGDVGKKIGGDISSNKKTLLLIDALKHADPQQQSAIHNLLKQPASDAKTVEMLMYYNRLKVKDRAEERKAHYLQEAFRHLDQIQRNEDQKKELIDTAQNLMVRIK